MGLFQTIGAVAGTVVGGPGLGTAIGGMAGSALDKEMEKKDDTPPKTSTNSNNNPDIIASFLSVTSEGSSGGSEMQLLALLA